MTIWRNTWVRSGMLLHGTSVNVTLPAKARRIQVVNLDGLPSSYKLWCKLDGIATERGNDCIPVTAETFQILVNGATSVSIFNPNESADIGYSIIVDTVE
jgi:hypothetical protein